MALFGRKSGEEKAEAKATKQARDLKRKAVAGMVSKVEQLNYGSALNVVADEVRLDEEALFVATGELDSEDSKAALVATDTRLVIGWMKGLSVGAVEIPYSDIDQIDTGTKLSGTWVTLHHGSHARTLEKSGTKDLDKLKQVVRDHQATGSPTPGASMSVEKLAELHAAGILTDEEFSAAKAKALGL